MVLSPIFRTILHSHTLGFKCKCSIECVVDKIHTLLCVCCCCCSCRQLTLTHPQFQLLMNDCDNDDNYVAWRDCCCICVPLNCVRTRKRMQCHTRTQYTYFHTSRNCISHLILSIRLDAFLSREQFSFVVEKKQRNYVYLTATSCQ